MKWRIIVPLLLALTFFGVTAVNEAEIEVSEVTDIALNAEGDVFILERTQREPILGIINRPNEWRVMKVDPNGKVMNEYVFKNDTSGRFQTHSRLEASKDGGLYIHSAEYNASTYFLTKESVGYLSADFSVWSNILDFDYAKEGDFAEYEKILSMNELEGQLYVYKASDDSHEKAMVYAYDPVANQSREIYEIILQDERKIDELIMTSKDQYLFRTMTGEVFFTTKDETPFKVYPIGTKALPTKLKYNENIGTYYYDPIRDDVIQINASDLSIVVNKDFDRMKDALRGDMSFNGVAMNSNGDMAGYTLESEELGVQVVLLTGRNPILLNSFLNEWSAIQDRASRNAIFGLVLGIVLVLLWVLYKRITEKRKPVLFKFTVVFVPLMLLMSFVLWTQTDALFGQMAEDDLYAELHHLATLQSSQINIEQLESINSAADHGSPEYTALEEEIYIDLSHFNTIKESAYERWVYGVLYRYIEGRLFVVVSDVKTMTPADYLYSEEAYQLYEEVLEDQHVVVGEEKDVLGEWMVALAPILNESGEVVGILEVGTGKETYAQYLVEQNKKILFFNLGAVLIILIILTAFITKLLSPLKSLTESVSRVAQGEWGTVIEVYSNDEIGVLTKLFNQMSVSIAEHFDNMQRLNEKYFKFVPQKFFDLLGKESILEVELGDQVQQSMAIVFMNLRDFFKTSAEMTPQESLQYINEAYGVFGNSITNGDGTIGAFRDSGQVGLFESIDKALVSAIQATEQIRKENASYGKSMDSGICVHEGSILIGVVGEENRMATSVMSDQVNHVVTLEAFADICDIRVVLSEPAYHQLENPDSYEMRFLGHVQLKGVDEPIGIYDVFEADPIQVRQLKQVSRIHFEEGVEHFEEGRIDEARKAFIRVLRTNRYDAAAHMYLMKCENMLEAGQQDTILVLMDLTQEAR